MIFDKPQLKPKTKTKSKAKPLAEVVHIITVSPCRAVPSRPVPVPQKVSTASTISPIEPKFSG